MQRDDVQGNDVQSVAMQGGDTATEFMCRKVARGAGGAAVRQLRTDSHWSSRAARGERRRPSRRRQRKARSSRRWKIGYGVTSRKERRQSEGGDRVRRARRN
jgi:hypothetical protein